MCSHASLDTASTVVPVVYVWSDASLNDGAHQVKCSKTVHLRVVSLDDEEGKINSWGKDGARRLRAVVDIELYFLVLDVGADEQFQ